MKQSLKLILPILILLLLPQISFAKHNQTIQIEILNDIKKIDLDIGDKAGGVSINISDLGNDQIPEIIVGNGLGFEPRVRVLRQDGTEIGSFLAYSPNVGIGINVVTCDLTGDGFNEIVVAPQRGGGPHIRIFNRYGKAIDNGGFFAYNKNFKGGVNLVCENLNDSKQSELVTLPGPDGGPHVKIWNFTKGTNKLINQFFAFDAKNRTGIIGAIHKKILHISQQKTSDPYIKSFSINSPIKLVDEKSLSLQAESVTSVFFANNKKYLTTSSNATIYNIDDEKTEKINSTHKSIAGTAADLNNDGIQEIIFAPSRVFIKNNEEKKIEINVTEQRLYAYKNGSLENTFLISSGLNNTTPIGKHNILAKIMNVHYKWTYGPNDPRNYDLGIIPYNLRIYPHIYLHYAPWHNNFGHKMSHGCINVSLENIKWLYAWSHKGIPVDVHE